MEENKFQDNNNSQNEEINLPENDLLQQILDIKEQFFPIFDLLKTNFIATYDEFYSKLFKEVYELGNKIGKYYNSGVEYDTYKKMMRENLEKVLENLNNIHKNFSEEADNFCKSCYKQISNYSMKEIEEYMNQIIEKKEKQMEEEKKMKGQEEEKKKNDEEEKKIKTEEKEEEKKKEEPKQEQEQKQMEEQKKIEDESKKETEEEKHKKIEEQKEEGETKELSQEKEMNKKEGIELVKDEEIHPIKLDGKNNKNSNMKLLENIEQFNKLIIKDMSKEDFEYILSNTLNVTDLFKKSDKNVTSKNEDFTQIDESNLDELQKSKTFSNTPNNPNSEESKRINSIKSINFSNINLENIKLDVLFPNLSRIKIKDSKMRFDLGNNFKFNTLLSIKLENIGLIDNNFNDLFDKIRRNEKIRNNLRILSVKNNKITYIDYKRGYADNILSSMIFTKLEVLDMSYNKLYYFQNQMFNCLEKIKLIDLTDNNIASPQGISGLIKSAKIKNCLLLITRNLSILKEPENERYNNYLKEILKKVNYPIKKITLDNIFCGNFYKNIFDLDFSFFKDSLSYLDLSNSQLTDKDLISLFDSKDNKWPFANLKSLILVANYLTQELLYTLSSDDKYRMDKLKILKLSENNIMCTDVEKFKKFLEFFKNLEILELKITPFENWVDQFFKQKFINFHDPDNRKKLTRPFNKDEKNIEQILDHHYLKENTKIKIYILDLNGGKYTEKIYQNFPVLTESLDIENKFPHKT